MLVATWNMQGATAAGESIWYVVGNLFLKQSRDVVLLQECGAPPNLKDLQEVDRRKWIGRPPVEAFTVRQGPLKFGASSGVTAWIMYVDCTSRCNLAILSNKEPRYYAYVDNQLDSDARPGIGIVYDQDLLFTLHGFSKSGNDTPSFINEVHAQAAGNVKNWFCGGDFNCDPAILKAKIAGADCKAQVWETGQVTRPISGKQYDYGVSSRAPGKCEVVPDSGKSDHSIVLFDYK